MITQKTYVFLFGSSDFEDESLPPIRNVEASLQHWEKFLLDEKYFGVPSSQVQVHLNKSRDEVMFAFTRFCNQIPNNSLLITYYAGHGVLDTEFSLFLSTPTSYVDSIQWTGISINQLREQLNKYKKLSKVVILDCCFSAKFFEGIMTTSEQVVETKIQEMEQQKGLFMMASSGANVPSKFDSSNPNVPMNFTENILQAIQEGSETSNEFVTAEQIFDRARELCIEKQLPTPHKLATKDGARIVFAKNTKFSNEQKLKNDWLQTQNQNTIFGYYDFINKYPNSLYEFEALDKIANLEDESFWKEAQNQDTLKGYLNYIRKYPDGDFIEEAKKRIKNKTTNQTEQQVNELVEPVEQSPKTEEIKQAFISTFKEQTLPKQEIQSNTKPTEITPAKEQNRKPIFIGIGVVLFFIVAFGIYSLFPKEEDVWQKTKTENTRAAYENFLSKYPKGTHYTKAESYLDSLEMASWQMAKNDTTEIAYQNYLTDYPNGKYKKQADSLIDILYWNKAITQNTKESYLSYKSERPDGLFTTRADSLLREIELFGDAEYQAKLKKEQTDFDKAEKANTKVSYQSYITTYSEGRFVAQAKERIIQLDNVAKLKKEQTDFDKAEKANTKDSYQSYITAYPEGKFTTQAKKAITQLEKEEQAQKEKLATLPQDIEKNMVYVQGGSFMMGSDDDEGTGFKKPAHKVTLSSFKVSKYEVTQAEWRAVMGTNPSEFSEFKGCGNCPVEHVSWNDTQVFLKKLNELTGKNYRLLTEAEWEYAARGGNKSKGYKYAGSNSLGSVAWYSKNSGEKTHPVGQKQPNELGLYDMSGNVWEWCQDWFDDEYYEKSNNLTNPVNNINIRKYKNSKVARGGSCGNAEYIRLTYRYLYINDNTISYGFRIGVSVSL